MRQILDMVNLLMRSRGEIVLGMNYCFTKKIFADVSGIEAANIRLINTKCYQIQLNCWTLPMFQLRSVASAEHIQADLN